MDLRTCTTGFRPPETDAGVAVTRVRGARMHNLRGVDCEFPLRRLTVITGVSGSGKSTLAFDVLYAEGQRRFVECMSAYARQFMERLERPQVEAIGRIQPPVAFRQRANIKNARSTVGSITELSDSIRLLFVHAGEARCPRCGGTVAGTDVEEALAALKQWPAGMRIAIVAPRDPRIDHADMKRLQRLGYTRLWIEGRVIDIEDWDGQVRECGDASGIVVDRLMNGQLRRSRLAEAFKAAWSLGGGECRLYPLAECDPDREGPRLVRQGFTCRDCGGALLPPSVPLFSWNNPLGACSECQGFGRVIVIDREKVIPDPRRNLRNHAVVPFSVPSARSWYRWLLKAARARAIPTDSPFRDLTPEQREWVFSGDSEFAGVNGFFEFLESKRYKMHVRVFISRFRGYAVCPKCGGARLRPEALAFRLGGLNIHELHQKPIDELGAFFHDLQLDAVRRRRVRAVLARVRARLECLTGLGVGYLALARTGRTLSSGETQRIRLAAALGSSLTDTLFVLDEPTVGLHAEDTGAMAAVLRRLTDAGNTVVVVEHDPQVIEQADHLIVLGPGGGRAGGRLIYEGPPGAFLRAQPDFFASRESSAIPPSVAGKPGRGPAIRAVTRSTRNALVVRDAREHNLRIPKLALPLQALCVITGVSGSGKSTLLDEILYRNWQRAQGRPVEAVGRVARIDGIDKTAAMHFVGQEPLGRSSRSNPISFVQAYTGIRELLAATPAARRRRLSAGAFSFNVAGGRCESCSGMGTQVLDMYFMPDVEVACETCRGRRFRPEILEVRYRGSNIHDILEMTVDEASASFHDQTRVVERLAPLREVGLGYILLGQSTATLSTGEAQRLRLASFLATSPDGERNVLLLDEPTTGLHAKDVGRLLRALRALIARGHSVIAIEHQLDFIRAADWVVDLGPGAGDRGGRVVYAGPVSGLLKTPASATGHALRAHLERVAAWKR